SELFDCHGFYESVLLPNLLYPFFRGHPFPYPCFCRAFCFAPGFYRDCFRDLSWNLWPDYDHGYAATFFPCFFLVRSEILYASYLGRYVL
ncbi:hypothetical protein L0F63_007500, partial [Massospora cicadina]